MFSDISILNFLIYAAGIGFAAAIIYINIQRTALSRFICHLIDNNCNSKLSSVSLDEIALSSIQKSIVKSAIKHQHGFKRCVACVFDKNSDEFFNDTDNSRYYLICEDTDSLKKKYSYKTMPPQFVVLFVTVLLVVVVLVSLFTGLIIDAITTPKTNFEESPDTDQSETVKDSDIQDVAIPNGNSDMVDKENYLEQDKTSGPRIPV